MQTKYISPADYIDRFTYKREDHKGRLIAKNCKKIPLYEIGDYALYENGQRLFGYWFPNHAYVGKVIGDTRSKDGEARAIEYLDMLAISDLMWNWALNNFQGDPVNGNLIEYGLEFGNRANGWLQLVGNRTLEPNGSKKSSIKSRKNKPKPDLVNPAQIDWSIFEKWGKTKSSPVLAEIVI